jgi:hypothetical protein
MMVATLFDAHPPDPGNDAAPTGIGAGVNGRNTPPDSTLARLRLTPPVRNDAPETSRVAADRYGNAANTARRNTEIPRRWELVKADAVVASGRKRKTRSNCPATVWVLSEFAPKPTTIAPATPGDAERGSA